MIRRADITTPRARRLLLQPINAATNERVRNGLWRRDLYNRIGPIWLKLPRSQRVSENEGRRHAPAPEHGGRRDDADESAGSETSAPAPVSPPRPPMRIGPTPPGADELDG